LIFENPLAESLIFYSEESYQLDSDSHPECRSCSKGQPETLLETDLCAACVHRGVGVTTTWSYGSSKMGELKLLHERFKSEQQHRAATATCLTLTACANFVLIGKPT
jgi:hypothetical protein